MKRYLHGDKVEVGMWVNFKPSPNQDSRAFCSGAHQIEKIAGSLLHYRNTQGELRSKAKTSILFIGTQEECKDAFRQGLELTKQLDKLHDSYLAKEMESVFALMHKLTAGKP